MEKIFHPNKWFVLFCGLLVLVWAGLQAVANMRIADEARLAGRRIFSWEWPGRSWFSRAEITDAKVVRRTDTDAIVKIKGHQYLNVPQAADPADKGKEKSEVVDCHATLTFYRSSNRWMLGKVELP